jgi:hypothetical protein
MLYQSSEHPKNMENHQKRTNALQAIDGQYTPQEGSFHQEV